MPRIELINNDCLIAMKDIADKSIDMILCDLPYGTTTCKWDIIIPFEPLWEQYNRVIKDNGAIVLFGKQPFASLLIASNISQFRYEWIWEKQKASNFLNTKFVPLHFHENILVFSKKTPIKYFPQRYKVLELDEIMSYSKKQMKNMFLSRDYDRFAVIDRRPNIITPTSNKEYLGTSIKRNRYKDDGFRNPKSVLKFNKKARTLHPTEKPTELLEYLIKTYTNEGELVLDNCMGSGSCGIACINTNRDFIGIEKDIDIFNRAKERIEVRYGTKQET